MSFAKALSLRHDKGSGRTLLFIHGWLMSGRVWEGQLPLATKFRILTVDLPGHGESKWHNFSYDLCVESIIGLLDALGIEKICLVGWSMGAQLALELYQKASQRISGIVLVSGTPQFCMTDEFKHGLPRAEARSMELRIKRNLQMSAGEFFKLMFNDGELTRLDIRKVAADLLTRLPELQVATDSLRALVKANYLEMLQLMSIPVLIIHGTDDRICRYEASLHMRCRIPLSELVPFSGIGHAPFITDPEHFNSTIAAFAERLT